MLLERSKFDMEYSNNVIAFEDMMSPETSTLKANYYNYGESAVYLLSVYNKRTVSCPIPKERIRYDIMSNRNVFQSIKQG